MKQGFDDSARFDRFTLLYDQRIKDGSVRGYLDTLKWRLIRQVLPREACSSILELSGGTGTWMIPLAKLGYSVTIVNGSMDGLAIAEEKVRAEGLERQVQLHCCDINSLDTLPAGSFSLVLTTGGFLKPCTQIRPAIRQMKRLCQPSGTIYLDPTSRFSHLPELLLKQDLNAVQDLVENGSFYESLEGNRIRRHEFEIKELLALLWDEGLTVVTIVGRSTLLGILGQAGMLKLLEDHEMGKLFEMEDYLSQNEALISLARHFETVCQVS